MTTELANRDAAEIIERVVIVGDLSKLTPQERVSYYRQVCESCGLSPLTKPFDYITLQGRLTLYARKDATDQLRRIHRVSVNIVGRDRIEDVYIVTARATMPDGRTDESTGAVNIAGLKGDQLANALMKSETKAKRRVTLSICGLGFLDETEIETIPGARRVQVDPHGAIPDEGASYDTHELRSQQRAELKRLRDQLRDIGGRVRPLTSSQVATMNADQLAEEINETAQAFQAFMAQDRQTEAPQQQAEAPAEDMEAVYDAVDADLARRAA